MIFKPVEGVAWNIDRQKLGQISQKLNVCDADRIFHQSLVPPSAEIFGVPGRHSPEVLAVGSDGERAINVNGQAEKIFQYFYEKISVQIR
jgi:hypothetical protein